jgi:ABC-type nitrate/sulfonate/bicarbonate transport system permease component
MARSATRRRTLNRRVRVWGLRLALVAVVVAVWMYLNGPGGVSPLILPKLGAVVTTFFGLFLEPTVWAQAGITVFEMVVAFAIAAIVGIGAGFVLSRGRISVRVSAPLLAWGYMFPIVMLYPLFLLWAGVGVESKIWYAAVSGFFPIAYNTIVGLRNVDQRYIKVGQAFGASSLQMDLNVKAGAARPMILSGLRIGVAIVTISVVVAELLGSNVGLGNAIEEASNRFQVVNAYSIILLLVGITAILQLAMEKVLATRYE